MTKKNSCKECEVIKSVEWAKNNRETINKREKARLKTDINYKIRKTISTRLVGALKGNGKKHSILKYLGCTISELKIYLESKFGKGMTWNNHGFRGWHIDHILPLSNFDLTKEENLYIVCNYKNLQPLWWRENIVKGNKEV